MKLGLVWACGFLGLMMLAPAAVSQEKSTTLTLQVRVNYTGSGTVDDKHKIYVVLWDSPTFVDGVDAMPVGMQEATSKSGSVTFSDVKKVPAYISAVFDKSGVWDAQSPPPEGSSLGLYRDEHGKPAPVDIKAGETAKIDLGFDDTFKMQGGKPNR